MLKIYLYFVILIYFMFYYYIRFRIKRCMLSRVKVFYCVYEKIVFFFNLVGGNFCFLGIFGEGSMGKKMEIIFDLG